MASLPPKVNALKLKPAKKLKNKLIQDDEIFLLKSSPVKHQTLQQIQSNQVTPNYQAPPDLENTVSERSEDGNFLLEVTFDDFKSHKVTNHMDRLEDFEEESLSSVYDIEDQSIYQWALS
jgi:hypothetical protein